MSKQFLAVEHRSSKKISDNLTEEQRGELIHAAIREGLPHEDLPEDQIVEQIDSQLIVEVRTVQEYVDDAFSGKNINILFSQFNPYTGESWPELFQPNGEQFGPFDWQ